MERLPSRQLRALLTFLEGLSAVSDADAFVSYLFTALPQLIRCHMLSCHEVVPSQRLSRDWRHPREIETPERDAIWVQHMREHPTLMHIMKQRDGQARMVSDFLSQSRYQRLGLYNELFRDLQVEDILTAAVYHGSATTPATIVGLGLYRERRTFSERDRLLLNLLRPHLAQTYARVGAHTRLQAELARANQVLEALEQGVIVLARDGSVRHMTLRARRLLAVYWGATADGTERLPTTLQDWANRQRGLGLLLERDEPPVPAEPFVRERDGTRLVARLLRPDREDHLLVLEEQRTSLSPSVFRPLGLTARESEVLLWVTHGKTDAEIAGILGVSANTVGKHLERIYQKLGVENRTAAAMRALTLIRSR